MKNRRENEGGEEIGKQRKRKNEGGRSHCNLFMTAMIKDVRQSEENEEPEREVKWRRARKNKREGGNKGGKSYCNLSEPIVLARLRT